MILDHVGIAVRSIDDVTQLYGAAFGLTVSERDELPGEGVRVAFLRTGAVDLELLEPLSAAGPLARFLATRGPGLHHIAFRVAEIQAALATAVAAGCTPIDAVPRRGARGSSIIFLQPSTTGGVLVELVQR